MAFTKLSPEQVAESFVAPPGKTVIDPELIAAFKECGKGEGLVIPKDPTLNPRKTKVRVNKAAKEAFREVDWSENAQGYVVRVINVLPNPNGAFEPTSQSGRGKGNAAE